MVSTDKEIVGMMDSDDVDDSNDLAAGPMMKAFDYKQPSNVKERRESEFGIGIQGIPADV